VTIRPFWDTAQCSLVEVDRRFRGEYGLHHQGDIALMMEAALTSETSVYSNGFIALYPRKLSSSYSPP
jgi:hypothetical protein